MRSLTKEEIEFCLDYDKIDVLSAIDFAQEHRMDIGLIKRVETMAHEIGKSLYGKNGKENREYVIDEVYKKLHPTKVKWKHANGKTYINSVKWVAEIGGRKRYYILGSDEIGEGLVKSNCVVEEIFD